MPNKPVRRLSMFEEWVYETERRCSELEFLLPKKSKAFESEDKVVKVALNARTAEVKLPKPKSKASEFEEKVVKVALNARAAEVELPKPIQNCCQCSLPSVSNHAFSRVVTSERSSGGNLKVCIAADASILDCQAKSKLTSQMSKFDPDSNGAVSALDDENVCVSFQLTTPAIDAALQEKEKLERRQREEKIKVGAQIRAAESAAKMKAEVELRKQRERDREGAQIALQKMENEAGIELNLDFKESGNSKWMLSFS
ncbi:hypothetical protein CRYUN_Cryun01aG0065400 [Craigia yunnanensis]